MTSSLVEPRSVSSEISSGLMISGPELPAAVVSDMSGSLGRQASSVGTGMGEAASAADTETAARSICSGVGRVVPGREAAALP